MKIERASPTDLEHIKALLDGCDLSSGDVTASMLNDFLVLRDSDSVIGSIGLERYADIALLRSLAVNPLHRRNGHGLWLLRAIEQHASKSGIGSLYLLTTTAARFFEAHGFRSMHRVDAPTKIQSTAQFSALCPSSSALMKKP